MGDNIYVGDRNGVRIPIQWTPDRGAGFSRVNPAKLYNPVVMDPVYGYEANRNEHSARKVSFRKGLPEGRKQASRPISRILCPGKPGRRSFLWAWDYSQALATYPRVTPRPLPNEVAKRATPLLLFCLAPCGVCPAPDVTIRAVRSYIKPLRAAPFHPYPGKPGRYVFCGAFRTGPTPPALPGEARPILAVSQHTALRSPDFPPRLAGAIARPAHL